MYDIKYSIIKVDLRVLNDSKFNIKKQSAIRGIIGNILINENCLMSADIRQCETCFINERCIANNIFSPKIKPLTNETIEESVSPFIVICDDKREFINKDEVLTFAMVFFGDTVAYIPTIIRAIKEAGKTIGLEKNLFELVKVFNDEEEIIYGDGKFNLSKINLKTVQEYINNRLSISSEVSRIEIINPIRFKKNKKFQDDLVVEDLINLIKRRLITLATLEGKLTEINKTFNFRIKNKELRWVEFNRYSNRQRSRMSLGGIIGTVELESVDNAAKELLIAGELIHIGKSTSFGLGDYILY